MAEPVATPGASVRPRDDGWGGADARAALRLIAEDARRRAGFEVCAIEVLRADDILEVVAVSGSDDGEEALLGQASPLSAMQPALALGAEYGAWTFVAQEWLTPAATREMLDYSWVPDLPESDDPTTWHALDMLVARVVDDRGHLRALVYLDLPVGGRRPDPDALRRLAADMQLVLRAVLTAIEREELSQQVRLATTARELVRTASSRVGYRELLVQAHAQLLAGFRADDLVVHVFADPQPTTEAAVDERRGAAHLPGPLVEAVAAAARRAWEAQEVVIAEPGRVWGDAELDGEHRTLLTDHLARHGAGLLVVAPVGAGREPLGALVVTRTLGGARWTESESWAALDIGHDLGRAILQTRAHDREQELIAELRRLDAYRAELIATVSHELKNPLGVISGHVEMMDSLPDLPPAARTSLRAMARGSARLTSVVDDLLLLSRMGNPDTPLERRPVDLRALLREVAEDEGVLADPRDISLHSHLGDEDVVVEGDPEELLRLLLNLVGNAVKYSRDGGSVDLTLTRRGDDVVFRCADDGLGISEDDRARLFTEFFRSTNPEALQRPGTGLGLAIVARIVARHGGRVEVASQLGVGTTFTVTLPAAG